MERIKTIVAELIKGALVLYALGWLSFRARLDALGALFDVEPLSARYLYEGGALVASVLEAVVSFGIGLLVAITLWLLVINDRRVLPALGEWIEFRPRLRFSLYVLGFAILTFVVKILFDRTLTPHAPGDASSFRLLLLVLLVTAWIYHRVRRWSSELGAAWLRYYPLLLLAAELILLPMVHGIDIRPHEYAYVRAHSIETRNNNEGVLLLQTDKDVLLGIDPNAARTISLQRELVRDLETLCARFDVSKGCCRSEKFAKGGPWAQACATPR